jgi:hypothetical protein
VSGRILYFEGQAFYVTDEGGVNKQDADGKEQFFLTPIEARTCTSAEFREMIMSAHHEKGSE